MDQSVGQLGKVSVGGGSRWAWIRGGEVPRRRWMVGLSAGIESPPSIERSLTSGGGWHFSLGARAVFWWYYKRLALVG